MTVNKLKKNISEDKTTISFLEKIAGPLAPEIITIFKQDSEYSPDEIAKKLNEKITNVRCTLNSLHYRGIACYKREKQNQKFYEFKWSIKFKKIIELVIEQELEKYKKLDESISEKKDRDYFVCPKKCVEVPFEIAAAYDFKCPNCNTILELIDIKNVVASIKRQKTKIKTNVEKLNEVLQHIEDKSRGYVCE
jgi:transcription initiation factor TFIIE subunit alpha